MSFFAMSIATTIYTSVDTTMIRFMKGYAENSFYSQSVKIKTALVNVVTALGAVLLPRASYYLEKGLEDEFLRISRKALTLYLLQRFHYHYILCWQQSRQFCSYLVISTHEALQRCS